jgi:hypothetical protein
MKRLMGGAILLLAITPYLVLGDGNAWLRGRPGDGKAVAAQADGGNWDGVQFETTLSGDEEVPPVDTETWGLFRIRFNDNFSAARFSVKVFNGTAITQAHLHCGPEGVNGPVVVFLAGNVPGGFDVNGTLSSFTMTSANIAAVNADCTALIGRDINTLAELAEAAADGLIYANVHSIAHPSGEVRGQLVHDDEDDDDGDNDNEGHDGDGGDGHNHDD